MQLESLQSVVEAQAQDRAASVSIIEQLQEQLRLARDAAADADAHAAQVEREAQDGAARDPGPGFVAVQELMAARDAGTDARAAHDASKAEVCELQRQLEEQTARLRAQAAEGAAVEGARADAARERRERESALQDKIAKLDARLLDTEGRLQEALPVAERAKEVCCMTPQLGL